MDYSGIDVYAVREKFDGEIYFFPIISRSEEEALAHLEKIKEEKIMIVDRNYSEDKY